MTEGGEGTMIDSQVGVVATSLHGEPHVVIGAENVL